MPSKKIDNEENKKKINLSKKSIIIIIITLILVIIAGTFAWLTWKSNETALVLTVGDIDDVQVVLKPYQINTEISPVLSYDNEEYVSVTATNNGKSSKMVKLFYQISNIDTELVSTDFKYTITKSTDNGVTYTEYLSGNFNTASSNSDFNIMEEEIPSNTIYKYRVYIWLDGNNIQSNVQGKSFKAELRTEIGAALPITVEQLVSKANLSTLSYKDATEEQKGEMWTFSHEATEQIEATTDYRYIGRTPNNYITFNDEVWRIIGVFDGRIKIIRNDSIGEMPWDYKKEMVGSSQSGYGSANWKDSQLMYMLNIETVLKEGYDFDGNNIIDANGDIVLQIVEGYGFDGIYIRDYWGNLIYQIGCLPSETVSGAESYNCTPTTWNLNETASSQISATTYYLGDADAYPNDGYGTASDIYNWEMVGKGVSEQSFICSVGLMYLSDYVYTFGNGVDDTCYTDVYNCETSSTGTPGSSWLYSSYDQWTLAVNTFSDLWSAIFASSAGNATDGETSSSLGVRPVVYLKSDIKLSGSGTSTSPYEIVE